MRKQQISKTTLGKSINACQQNAQRLIEDAQTLEFEKPPSSKYYLSIISQEESAKAFLLYLVKREIISWNEFILRAVNSHVCKQLVGIVIDYIEPDLNTFISGIGAKVSTPKKVKDALNLLRNEIIKRWESKNWVWADEYTYDPEAKKVFKGHLDELKQSALYVNLNKTAGVISTPAIITPAMAQEEFEKAKRFYLFGLNISKNEKNNSMGYEEIEEIFRMLFSDAK